MSAAFVVTLFALQATATEIPQMLEDRVAAAVARRWGVPSGRVRLEWTQDPRTGRLSPDASFRIAGRGRDGRMIAIVSRPESREVALPFRAATVDSVPVAARPLLPGHLLSASDIRFEPLRVWGPPQLGRPTVPGPGWIVRLPLATGERFRTTAARPPTVVRRGQRIQVSIRRKGVRVSRDGLALADAALGERVAVRLLDQRKKLLGRVTGPGAVLLER